MSIVTSTPAGTAYPPYGRPDPFFYGWRFINETNEEGVSQTRQVPLTEEDILHPQEYDFIMHTPWHDKICGYLRNALGVRFKDKAGAEVLIDTRVDWEVPEGWCHGPDVIVFFDTKEPFPKNEATYYVKEMNAKPALIIEVTSPSTMAADFGDKMHEYLRVGVPTYVIINLPRELDRPINLFGFKAGPRQYQPLMLDQKGRIWLETAQLWLGAEGEHVFLEDETGVRILDYPELAERANNAELRIKELAAQLARLQKDKTD